MNLLVIGDVALVDENARQWEWMPPAELAIGDETQVLFNWELPIGQALNPAPRSSGPRLMASHDSIRALRRWAPGFATLATNHVLDAGPAGLSTTLSSLHSEGFTTVGAGLTPPEIARPLWWETAQGRLAVLNWVFPETHPDWMSVPGPNCWPGVAGAARRVQEIRQDADWVLCVVHWSDEHFAYPRPEDRTVARDLIRAGADCLIGHHPHVVRGSEIIAGRRVFYSVGNFYFSDISDGKGGWTSREAPRNREGLGVLIRLRRGESPQCQIWSFWNEGSQVVLDRAGRGCKRMVRSSQALEKYGESEYEQWYVAKRALFDRWSSRWHFGVRRLGVRRTIRRLFQMSALLG